MAEKIFVTGASGRIGLHLVRALVSRGFEVWTQSRGAEGAERARQAGAAESLAGELRDVLTLERGCEGAHRVFHLAGGFRGPGPETPDRLNREGTRNLLDAIERCSRAPERVIFASSAAVYGDRSSLWVDEDFTPSPNTRYGRSKAAAESLLLDAQRQRGLEVVIARIAAVYGPSFPILMEGAIRSGRAWLPGEGRNLMPLVHVDDAVAALLRLSEGAAPGSIYHVAGRDQPSLGEFYAAWARRIGGRPPHFWSTYVPSWAQTSLAAFNERVQSHLPRKPAFTPDFLRLLTASVRLRTERIQGELGFQWRYPEVGAGLDAIVASSSSESPN